MKLIAAQAFRYGERVLKPGDTFDAASDEDARILKGVGRARDGDGDLETRALETTDAPDLLDQPKKSKRYNRRDMRAKV